MEITEQFLQSALESLKREIFESLHVAMPGTIVSYDSTACTAAIQPALRRQTQSGTILTAPQLSSVPVFLPSASHTVFPGDPCLLLFMDFCLDGYLTNRQPVLPPSPRQHDLSDAIALVGFGAFSGNATAP